ncbi:hypothetical protein H5410_026042 [Solanum commersonii]|uniref:Uncharacterized protein n=1 Tax=Solanum commersonii TaxID=4109 RepID=A0A9J5Z0B7_SOLCO|nr:hypothetical protein H5410_026042 [Solanum commersonii]
MARNFDLKGRPFESQLDLIEHEETKQKPNVKMALEVYDRREYAMERWRIVPTCTRWIVTIFQRHILEKQKRLLVAVVNCFLEARPKV